MKNQISYKLQQAVDLSEIVEVIHKINEYVFYGCLDILYEFNTIVITCADKEICTIFVATRKRKWVQIDYTGNLWACYVCEIIGRSIAFIYNAQGYDNTWKISPPRPLRYFSFKTIMQNYAGSLWGYFLYCKLAPKKYRREETKNLLRDKLLKRIDITPEKIASMLEPYMIGGQK